MIFPLKSWEATGALRLEAYFSTPSLITNIRYGHIDTSGLKILSFDKFKVIFISCFFLIFHRSYQNNTNLQI